MFGLLLLSQLAAASPLVGEELRWEVRYLGVPGGHVTARTERVGALLVTTGTARSAPWYRRIYDLDDVVTSTWSPEAGSARYEARFREGRFHQDQDQRFAGGQVTVDYGQRRRGRWDTWTDRRAVPDGVFDPVAAMQVVRFLEGPGPWSVPVFSGRETWPLAVRLVERTEIESDLLGAVAVRVLDLTTQHRGELSQAGRFVLHVTDDDQRLIVRAVVRSNLGPIQADLIEAAPTRLGTPGPAGLSPPDPPGRPRTPDHRRP